MAKAMTEFKVPGAAVAVVKDGKIVFARGYGFFRGSPPRKLIPRHGTRFDIQDSTGITLEFKQDAAGKAQEVVVYTPDSAFVVPRKL
jgi:Beta-lactamase